MPLPSRRLSDEHLTYLARHAVTPETAEQFGVMTITEENCPDDFNGWRGFLPGILFPWRTPSGKTVHQFRPDEPPTDDHGRPKKYLFPAGSGSNIGVIRESMTGPVVFIEGTKQALASYPLLTRCSIYAIAGCRSWSTDGIPEADLEVVDGRDVILIFDADLATNHDVWEAAKRFTAALSAEGANSVKYVIIPAGGKAGLDDVLGNRDPDRRKVYLDRLIDQAVNKLPREPKVRKGSSANSSKYFDPQVGFLAETLAHDVFDQSPLLLTREENVAVYRDGVYRIDKLGLMAVVSTLLGEQYRPHLLTTVTDKLASALSDMGLRVPDHQAEPLLNCRNGMVDIRTGERLDHDPDYLSIVQIPIEYDPTAKCPTYEAWLASQIPDQVDDLEEIISQMLDPSRTPKRALFAFGPARSGKSTLLRLMEAVAGMENVSGVPLHALDEAGFAPANVYGKMLNAAADLSASEVNDLSVFKKMTGDDLIHANRKYGKQFFFRNKALFAFAANEVPQVSESSNAYRERVKPFKFGRSFAGAEDPTIEEKMITEELPGILNRWIKAGQRLRERGHFLETDTYVKREFETASDRVRQWVDDEMAIVPAHYGQEVPASDATAPRQLYAKFSVWAERVGGTKLGEKRFLARVKLIEGVNEVKMGPNRQTGINIRERKDSDPDTSDTYDAIKSSSENAHSESDFPYMQTIGPQVSEVSGEPEDTPEQLWTELDN